MPADAAALTARARGLRAAHRVLGPGILWWARATVTGRGHVPAGGGVLLAANHRSFLDHFVLGAACPRVPRFLGKRELARGVGGLVNVHLGGMVPVDRGHADLMAVETVIRLLQAGEIMGVFPEGTRSPTGELFRFRSGLGRIAAAARVPTVPVGLRGTAEAWPLGTSLPRRRPPAGLVQVRFAPPISPPGADARARRAFTAAVHAAVAERCEQPLADRFAPVEQAAVHR
jgi:1-acyl-sn-glycerol-3-phosphate acyltransferase